MNRITLALLMLLPFLGLSQSFEWVATPTINFSWNPNMIAYVTTCDGDGNAYFAGYKDNAFAYSEIMGDVYFNKYDATGNAVFSKTISGRVAVSKLLADSTGAIYLLAFYVNTLSVDSLERNTTNQGEQPILIKFDANGNVLWHYEPQTNGEPVAYCRAMAIDALDQIYLGFNDYENAYIEKLSPQAGLLATIVQQHVRMISSVSVDNQGNVYSAGGCAEFNSAFAGVSAPAPFTYTTYLAKFNAAGVFQWVKYVEDITCPEPQVKAIEPNTVYFSSYLFGGFTFGDFIAERPISGAFSDAFITKLNSDGHYQWIREVPGAGYLATGNRDYLTADAEGNVYFSGKTRGEVNWDEQHQTSTNGFNNDALLLKYNSGGELLMAQTAGGNSEDRFDSVAVASNGEIYVSGMASGSASFGNLNHEAPPFIYYPFVAKMSSGALGIRQSAQPSVGLVPNPVESSFHLTGINGNHQGIIFSMLGQKVKQFEVMGDAPVDISALEKGVYFLDIDQTRLKILKR